MKIKQYALITLFAVPALALPVISGTVRADAESAADRAKVAAAEVKGNVQNHYDRYGNVIDKAEAIGTWKTMLEERRPHYAQPTPKKKNERIDYSHGWDSSHRDDFNPWDRSNWDNSNKALTRALIGGLGFAAISYANNMKGPYIVLSVFIGALVGLNPALAN